MSIFAEDKKILYGAFMQSALNSSTAAMGQLGSVHYLGHAVTHRMARPVPVDSFVRIRGAALSSCPVMTAPKQSSVSLQSLQSPTAGLYNQPPERARAKRKRTEMPGTMLSSPKGTYADSLTANLFPSTKISATIPQRRKAYRRKPAIIASFDQPASRGDGCGAIETGRSEEISVARLVS